MCIKHANMLTQEPAELPLALYLIHHPRLVNSVALHGGEKFKVCQYLIQQHIIILCTHMIMYIIHIILNWPNNSKLPFLVPQFHSCLSVTTTVCFIWNIIFEFNFHFLCRSKKRGDGCFLVTNMVCILAK